MKNESGFDAVEYVLEARRAYLKKEIDLDKFGALLREVWLNRVEWDYIHALQHKGDKK